MGNASVNVFTIKDGTGWYALDKQTYDEGFDFYTLRSESWPHSHLGWGSRDLHDIVNCLAKEQDRHCPIPDFLTGEAREIYESVNRLREKAIKMSETEIGIQ